MDSPVVLNLPFLGIWFPQREASMKPSGGLIQENFFFSCFCAPRHNFPQMWVHSTCKADGLIEFN